ncbi:MAG: hypothetical protein ACK4QL_02665 [Pseudanabaenaceae cyanobacterium]
MSLRQWFNPKPYLVVGGLVLFIQDWQMAVALGAGTIAMFSVYLQQHKGRPWLRYIKKIWQSPQRPLVVSVVAGAGAVVLTQMILAIWLEVPNRWLAVAIIVQLVSTLGVLLLLLQQAWQEELADPLDGLVAQLLSADVSDRLLALKRLSQHLQTKRPPELPPAQQQLIIDLCHTVMARESVPVVQKAVQETLQLLQPPNAP